MNEQGAIAGAIIGQICAIIGWLVSAAELEGEVTIDSTGQNYPMLTGTYSCTRWFLLLLALPNHAHTPVTQGRDMDRCELVFPQAEMMG